MKFKKYNSSAYNTRNTGMLFWHDTAKWTLVRHDSYAGVMSTRLYADIMSVRLKAKKRDGMA